jgi:hypothetical protein
MSLLNPLFPLAVWKDIKKANIEQWEAQKKQCKLQCVLCGFPLPDVNIHLMVPTDRCSVCVDLETTLHNRRYWGDLNREDAARRGRMGID